MALTKLGIQNFRVFGSETMTEFEFAPITLLTGANNSGKSSVLKALSLLKNSFDKNGNIEKLNFEGLDLGTYEMNVNNKKKDLIIQIFRGDNLCIEYHYGTTQELKIIHINYNSQKFAKIEEKAVFINFLLFRKIAKNSILSKNNILFKDYFEEDLESSKKPLVNQKNKGLRELKKLERIFLKQIEYSNSELSQKLIRFFNEDMLVEDDDILDAYYFPTPTINVSLTYFFQYLRILENYNKFSGNDDEMPFIETNELYLSETGKSFFRMIRQVIPNLILDGSLFKLSYLSAHKANQQILHTTDNQKTDFSILLKTYIKLTNDRKDYVNQKIRTLLGFSDKTELIIKNLGENLQIEAYVAYLKDEKKETLLSNLGFGVTQLITLLMQIVVSEKGQTIIIEEPETNLHPKLQTQLAELFIQAHKDFGIRFIIETHSEHLIRGLQLAIAHQTQGISNNVAKIYNLAKIDNKIQVNDILFENNGGLDFTKISDGLFDNAYKIQYKLVNHQLTNFLNTFTKLKAANTNKTTEEINEAVEKKLQDEIKFFITGQNITTYKEIVKKNLADIGGADRSGKIDVQTFEYLASAEFLMEHIEKCNLANPDYSPAVLQYGRAVENELGKFFEDFNASLPSTQKLSTFVSPSPEEKFNGEKIHKIKYDKPTFSQCMFLLFAFSKFYATNSTHTDYLKFRNFAFTTVPIRFNEAKFFAINYKRLSGAKDTTTGETPIGVNEINNKLLASIIEYRNRAGHPSNGLRKQQAEEMQTWTINFFQQWISAKL